MLGLKLNHVSKRGYWWCTDHFPCYMLQCGCCIRIKRHLNSAYNSFEIQIKENIKAPRHWPLCGEFAGDRWIPRTNSQLREICFHLMTSSCIGVKLPWKFSGAFDFQWVSCIYPGLYWQACIYQWYMVQDVPWSIHRFCIRTGLVKDVGLQNSQWYRECLLIVDFHRLTHWSLGDATVILNK